MPRLSDSPTDLSDDLESLTDVRAGDEDDGEEVEVVEEEDEPEEVEGGEEVEEEIVEEEDEPVEVEGGEEEDEVEEVVEEEKEEDAAEDDEEDEEEAEAEVMEVEEEEEEEVEDEMVKEEDEDCEAGADLLDEDAMDSSEEMEPEELAGGPESVPCTHDRSSINLMTITHGKDGNSGSPTAVDPSDDSNSEALLTKETPKEASKDAKETQEGRTYFTLKNSVVDENIRSDPCEDIDVGGENVKAGDIVVKKTPTSHKITDLQTPKDSSLSSIQTPQRRPRSSSPGATVEDANKRPALICTFFASGWCIKGKSCRFLHQKEELLNTKLQKKGDLAGPSKEGDSLDGNTGSREDAERQKRSASEELLNPSHADSSSKSHSTLQRDLVRTYGGENHGLPKSYNDHSMLEVNPQSGLESYPSKNECRQTLIQEEYRRPFGVNTNFVTSDVIQSTADDSLSRKYQDEGKMFQEPRVDSLNDSPFTNNSLVPEYKYHSGGSSVLSSLNPNSNNYLSYTEKTDELFSRSQQSHFPPTDSYTKYCLSSSLNSDLNSPLQPVRNPPSVDAFGQTGTLSSRGSAPLCAEHLDSRSTSVFDRGYYGSRSTSLPINSSPLYLRNEVENIIQPNVPRDLPAFAGQRTQVQDAWAPSVPFRSAFLNAPTNISSSVSQYDPLLDSIEQPPKIANTTFQSSERTIIHNVSSQHMNGDPVISGSRTPGYNTQNSLSSFRQTNEGALGEDTSAHGLSGFTTAVTIPVPSTVDRVNSSVPREDKHKIPGHAVDGANVNEGNPNRPDGNRRNVEDKGRNNKESKAMKFFRAALVDFIKELVKPFWREGHLSKDAHKMIVKKAVEKVLSAIQPHQVPSTSDSVNQYLFTSRAKLLKLVEGYVDKYIKSGAS